MAVKKKHAGGRPNKYTEAIGDEICIRMAGGESVRQICRGFREEDPDAEIYPSRVTINAWLLEGVKEDADKEMKRFLSQYRVAEELRASELFDEIEEIADDGRNDWEERENRDGTTYIALNGEVIGRSRLRVDARKWKLSKMLPKLYGDRKEIEHSGSIGIDPATALIEAIKDRKAKRGIK